MQSKERGSFRVRFVQEMIINGEEISEVKGDMTVGENMTWNLQREQVSTRSLLEAHCLRNLTELQMSIR